MGLESKTKPKSEKERGNNNGDLSPKTVLNIQSEMFCDREPSTMMVLEGESSEDESNSIQVQTTPTTQVSTSNATTTTPSNTRNKGHLVLCGIKKLYILALTVLWIGYLFTSSCVYYLDKYVEPIFEKSGQTLVHEEMDDEYNNRNGGMTYFLRECDEKDFTSFEQDDITWDETQSTEDFVELIMHHGAGIMPDLLQPATVTSLRNVILRMNEATSFEKMFSLKEHGNRWSLRLNPYDQTLDPDKIIQKALKEVADHTVVRKTLENILGPDPVMVELAAITSTPGALTQSYHCDTWYDASHLAYARTYGAVYSMFVYLQDTYVDMGVTGLCLGTHTCAGIYDTPCIFPTVASGTGAILNSQLYHQGSGNSAHQREDGTRVMFIITFASRPRDDDPRLLPLGSVYGIPWYAWGYNLNDYHIMGENNWITSAMQAVGLRKMGKNIGVSFLMGTAIARAENFNSGNDDEWFLERDYWADASEKLLKVNIAALLFYVVVSISVLFCKRKSMPNHKPSTFLEKCFTEHKALMKFYTTSVLFSYIFFFVYSKTKFAQLIESEKFQSISLFKPLSESQLAPSYIESITSPAYSDVIFGDKLDAYYTYHNTYFYDFHPGNYEYRNVLKQHAFDWMHHIPSSAKKLFIQSLIVDQLDSDFFLKQNDFGHWAILNDNDISSAVERDLYNEQYPIVRVVLKELDFILSQCKYGDGGRTYLGAFANTTAALSKFHLPSFVNKLRERILFPLSVDKHSNVSPSLMTAQNIFSAFRCRDSRILAVPTLLAKQVYRSPTNLLEELNDDSHESLYHPSQQKYRTLSRTDTNEQNMMVQESTKYGVLQNITVGGYEEMIDMIEYMKELPYEIVDTEWMDLLSFDKALKIMRDCKNNNQYCSHWASHGLCDIEENQQYLMTECAPSCQICHYMHDD